MFDRFVACVLKFSQNYKTLLRFINKKSLVAARHFVTHCAANSNLKPTEQHVNDRQTIGQKQTDIMTVTIFELFIAAKYSYNERIK